MGKMKFLLYGANGYTGKLIAEHAHEYGLTPILAGRSEDKIRPLAQQLGYEYLIFDLSETKKLEEALQKVKVVLHAAGPFIYTARPMLEACIRKGIHYLDITGEIQVFEMAAKLDSIAKQAGIMLMPGVGFDVVPTDCLAKFLKQQLPDAAHLKLAFIPLGGRLSHGTAMTMAEGLGSGGAMRKNGKIIKVPIGHDTVLVPYEKKQLLAVSIPWGDVATAFYTTGIPNITTYTGMKPSTYKWLKWQKYFNWFLRLPLIKAYVKNKIKQRPAGPSTEELITSKTIVWGQASNEYNKKQAMLIVPNGYLLTVKTALIITKKVLEGNFATGFQTPAGVFGADLITNEVEGVVREML